MSPDYATLLSGVTIIGEFAGNGLVNLSAMAYQEDIVAHKNSSWTRVEE